MMSNKVFSRELNAGYNFEETHTNPNREKITQADLFEQLMLFDKIVLSTNRHNSALSYLIRRYGLEDTLRLLDLRIVELMIWTPVIITKADDADGKTSRQGSILSPGEPPIVAAELSDSDSDPEKNIDLALSRLGLNRRIRRLFKKSALKQYTVLDGHEFSGEAADLILDSYRNNNLQYLDLPFNKEPHLLNFQERQRLMNLSDEVIETAVVSKYSIKSYQNEAVRKIYKANLTNLGEAYNVHNNSSAVFTIEGVANLRELFMNNTFDLKEILKLRQSRSAKYYRRWINEVSNDTEAISVTEEYLNEIKGSNAFFKSRGGRFVKNLGVFGVSTALGSAIAGIPGMAAGYTFGLLEEYWLNQILEGRSPSMFVDTVKLDVREKNKTDG